MQKLILLLTLALLSTLFLTDCALGRGGGKVDDVITTAFIVRHAEKEPTGDDPNLSLEGRQRALRLAVMLSDVPIQAVYSTDTRRTRQTAEPTAEQHRVNIRNYRPNEQDDLADRIRRNRDGSTVLVVGHSNTVPELLGLLDEGNTYNLIPESEYDNLYVVMITDRGRTRVIKLKY